MVNFYTKCPECERSTVCASNIAKLTTVGAIPVAAATAAGVVALPAIGESPLSIIKSASFYFLKYLSKGFTSGGIAAGSMAAGIQSGIGSVAAGSWFATLTSWGATGFGATLFGSAGAASSAIGVAATVAAKLDWCNDKTPFLRLNVADRSCKDGCKTTYLMSVIHIENLDTELVLEFKLRDKKYKLRLFKADGHLGMDLTGTAGKLKLAVRILAQNENVPPVEHRKLQHIEANSALSMNRLISWTELFNQEKRFVDKAVVKIEIDITDGMFFEHLREVTEEELKMKSLFGGTDERTKVSGYLDVTKIEKKCKEGCVTALELTVSNVHQLMNVFYNKQKIEARDAAWTFGITRHYGDYVGLEMVPDNKCNVRLLIQIRSASENVPSIRKVVFCDVKAGKKLLVKELISWEKLIKPENRFVQNSTVHIEIEITDRKYLTDLSELSRNANPTNVQAITPNSQQYAEITSPPSYETLMWGEQSQSRETENGADAVVEDDEMTCKFCQQIFGDQELSSVRCGHTFCTECIERTIRAFGVCPTCKLPATLMDLRKANRLYGNVIL